MPEGTLCASIFCESPWSVGRKATMHIARRSPGWLFGWRQRVTIDVSQTSGLWICQYIDAFGCADHFWNINQVMFDFAIFRMVRAIFFLALVLVVIGIRYDHNQVGSFYLSMTSSILKKKGCLGLPWLGKTNAWDLALRRWLPLSLSLLLDHYDEKWRLLLLCVRTIRFIESITMIEMMMCSDWVESMWSQRKIWIWGFQLDATLSLPIRPIVVVESIYACDALCLPTAFNFSFWNEHVKTSLNNMVSHLSTASNSW